MSAYSQGKFNPAYDKSMQFRPLPKGTYQAKIEMQDPDPTTRWTEKVGRDGETSSWAKYVATIITGEFTGRKVYGVFSTKLNKLGGTNCHETIQAAGRGADLYNVSGPEDLMDLVDSALANGPIVTIEVDWEAPFKDAMGQINYNDKVRGMDKFPTDENGNPIHSFVKSDDEGNPLGTYTAQAIIRSVRA